MAASRNSRSPDLPGHLACRLAALLGAGEVGPVSPSPPPVALRNLTVALSGGRDSVALLAALAQVAPARGWTVTAVHVHHGLSPHADAWADFCRALCQRLGVPLAVHRVQVADSDGKGLEAAARRARYGVFAQLEGEALVLGHHQEDQAETLLFNLLRGSGVRGLAAMPARRLLPRPGQPPLALLRPLLEVPRARIEAWLQAQGLGWIEDESNADTAFSRNFLRQEVMPLLQSRFPAASSLSRAARLAGEGESLLEELAAQDLAQVAGEGCLALARLAALSPARQRNLLRYWLRRHGLTMPDEAALDELLHQLADCRADSRLSWQCEPGWVHAWRGGLYLEKPGALPPAQGVAWQGQARLPWGDGGVVWQPVVGLGIAAARLVGGARLLCRCGGEKLALPGRPRKALKQLLQEADIPPWQRETLPLLWIGERLAWVPGIGVAAEFVCAEGEAGWEVIWESGASQPAAPVGEDGTV